jgi:hypothetical protein
MQFVLSMLIGVLVTLSAVAEESNFDYEKFTNDYFSAWANVQRPNAGQDDLEKYLSFLTDDVGYQHLPYSSDDSRVPNGKESMRKGMVHYLGIHTEYAANLTNHSHGHNVIMIEYDTSAKGVHPDNGQLVTVDYHSFEVLEIENGKVSVIRHYSE